LYALNNCPDLKVGLNSYPTPIDIDLHEQMRVQQFVNVANTTNVKDAVSLIIACPAHAMGVKYNKVKHSIIWTMSETPPFDSTKFPGNKIQKWLSEVDDIWVPTALDAERFGSLGLNDKIKKFNIGYRNDLFNLEAKEYPLDIIDNKNRFTFLCDATWSPRKGIKYILEAYFKSCKASDPVNLVLLSKYSTRPYGFLYHSCNLLRSVTNKIPFCKKLPVFKDIEYYANSRWSIIDEYNRMVDDICRRNGLDRHNLPKVQLIDIPVHECLMPMFYAASNCLIGASLGESTWLPGLQAFAMNMPVIQMQDNWGGYAEYCDPAYPLIYGPKEYRKAEKDLYKGTSLYFYDQSFPIPCVEALEAKIQFVIENYDRCVGLTTDIGDKVRSEWSWESKMKKVVNEVSSFK
tara:strand:- start:3636 stop:4847 length:1212 start_codon:yes stop_codon:yes gene_type:complete